MLIKSDSDKSFGYFIPSNLDFKDEKFIKTRKQLAFYWINNSELVTCVSKEDEAKIFSNEHNFILLEWRMSIKNNRLGKDSAGLYNDYWEGMKSGNDGYPEKGRHKSYPIG